MTLCIAAHARSMDMKPSIVLCCDSLVTVGTGVSETARKYKLRFLPGLACMFAGVDEHAQDLMRLYQTRLASYTPSLADIKEQLWVGMKQFESDLQRREITLTPHDLRMLVAGFIDGQTEIIYVDQEKVFDVPIFQAIGIGAESAQGILSWRNPAVHWVIGDVMYFLYEAKRISEVDPYVGKQTNMFVLEQSSRGSLLAYEVVGTGYTFLEQQFERFGPQSLTHDDQFPGDGLRAR